MPKCKCDNAEHSFLPDNTVKIGRYVVVTGISTMVMTCQDCGKEKDEIFASGIFGDLTGDIEVKQKQRKIQQNPVKHAWVADE